MPLFEFSDRREQFESSLLSSDIIFGAQDEFRRPSARRAVGSVALCGASGEELLLLFGESHWSTHQRFFGRSTRIEVTNGAGPVDWPSNFRSIEPVHVRLNWSGACARALTADRANSEMMARRMPPNLRESFSVFDILVFRNHMRRSAALSR